MHPLPILGGVLLCVAALVFPVGLAAQQQCASLDANWATVPVNDLLPTLPDELTGHPLVARAERVIVNIVFDGDGKLHMTDVYVSGPFREKDLHDFRDQLRAALPGVAEPGTRSRLMLVRRETVSAEPIILEQACNPEIANMNQLAEELAGLQRRRELRPGIAHVRILIDSDGRVVSATIGKGSGHTATDQALLHIARRTVFSPARYDGIPVSAWVELPLRFTRATAGLR